MFPEINANYYNFFYKYLLTCIYFDSQMYRFCFRSGKCAEKLQNYLIFLAKSVIFLCKKSYLWCNLVIVLKLNVLWH